MPISPVHDLEADALYITLSEGAAARSIELDSGTLVDVDAAGKPLGLEVIHPHRVWPLDEFIRQFNVPADDALALRLYAQSFRRPTPSFGRVREVSSGSGKLTRFRPAAI